MEYNFTFNKDNPYWTSSRIYNLFYLHVQTNFFNDKLHVYGRIYLFEVLDMLGIRDDSYECRNSCWDLKNGDYVTLFMNEQKRGHSNVKVTIYGFNPC